MVFTTAESTVMTIQSTGIVKVEKSDSSGLNAHFLVNNSESASGLSMLGSGSSFSSGGWAPVTDAGHIRTSAGSANGLVLQASAGDMRFYVDGSPTERMRIASDGEVFIGEGLGNTNRSTLLSISGAYQEAGGALAHMGIYSSDSYAQDKGGSLLFGGQDGSVAKQYFAGIKGAKVNTTSGNYAGYMAFYTRPAGAVSGERVRINSLGDLLLNQVTNDTRLGIKQRSSTVDFITCRNASSTLKFYVHSSGNTYNTNGNYSQISDQSLKENIVDANSQWNDIKNIKIRNFNFTTASGLDTHTQIGCVAQEVEAVSPKLVTAPREDGIKTVATSVLYMKAVKALQEAMARIETLEAKVATLEGS